MELLTTQQVCDWLGITPPTLRQWRRIYSWRCYGAGQQDFYNYDEISETITTEKEYKK